MTNIGMKKELQRLSSVLFLLIQPCLIRFQLTKPEICHGLCFCSSQEAVVDCSPQDRVLGLPKNLPPGTKKLIIQGGLFPPPGRLSRKNLIGLNHIISLKIINSQLRSIEPNAFLGMTNLRNLDLSLNHLHNLERNTFYGLKLTNLYLQEQIIQTPKNPQSELATSVEGLQLDEDVFQGMSAVQINLFRNGLSDLPFRPFSRVAGLEKLILSGNNIKKLDPKFSEYFDHADKLIDLTDNPLICACNLAWLANRVRSWKMHLPSLNTTCLPNKYTRVSTDNKEVEKNDKRYLPVELQKLSTNHLCTSTRIHAIDIELSPSVSMAKLRCTAVSYKSPLRTHMSSDLDSNLYHNDHVVDIFPPILAWKYMDPNEMRQVSWSSSQSDNPELRDSIQQKAEGNEATTTVELNVSVIETERKFTCVAMDAQQNDYEVLITLRGPIRNYSHSMKSAEAVSTAFIKSLDKTEELQNSNQKSEKNHNIAKVSQNSFLFRKQYTLLEMAGAIIGTFLFTLVLLVIFSRCISLYRTKGFNFHQQPISTSSNDFKAVPTLNCPLQWGYEADIVPSAEFNKNAPISIYDTRTSGVPNICTNFSPYMPKSNHHLYSQSIQNSRTTPLLHSDLIATQCCQASSAFWPAAPGSVYSGAGSQVYDIPQSMDISDCNVNFTANPNLAANNLHAFSSAYCDQTGRS